MSPPPTASEAPELPPNWFPRPHLECSPREAAEKLALDRPPMLVDCRRDDERRLASLAGSIHVPMPLVPEWIEELREDPSLASREMIVHCHHGVRSLQVVGLLHAAGFTAARSMAGGIDWWSVSVDPAIPRY